MIFFSFKNIFHSLMDIHKEKILNKWSVLYIFKYNFFNSCKNSLNFAFYLFIYYCIFSVFFSLSFFFEGGGRGLKIHLWQLCKFLAVYKNYRIQLFIANTFFCQNLLFTKKKAKFTPLFLYLYNVKI